MSLKLENSSLSNMTDNVEDIIINSMNTDGASGEEETFYQNAEWSQQFGYFNKIPNLKSSLIQKVNWIVGGGYTCDTFTEVILDHISGWGKDTFLDIIYNQVLVSLIGGDSYAEIIRGTDEKGEEIIVNLKPLDPGSMRIVVNKKGILKRFEQVSKVSGEKVKFQPEDIFYLSSDRIADQIHGISKIIAMEDSINAYNESAKDTRTIMHHQAKPIIVFKLGTDDTAKIDAFAAKMDAAVNKGENIYVPSDDNTFSYEVIQAQPSPLVLQWRDDLRKEFYRNIELPELLPSGGGDATESGGKIGYLTFSQIIQKEQLFLEKQIYNQLGLDLEFNIPQDISQNLQADNAKDPNAFQPSDMMAGAGR